MEYRVEWHDADGTEWVRHVSGTFEEACEVARDLDGSERSEVFLDGEKVWSYDGREVQA